MQNEMQTSENKHEMIDGNFTYLTALTESPKHFG